NSDFGDQFQGYEAAIFLGLCSKELGDNRKAYDAFDSALGIKGFYDQDEKGHYKFDPVAQDIVVRAEYFKAQAMNDIHDYDTALKAVAELFDYCPEMKKDPLGFAARIEEGKAVAGKGDLKKAIQLLEKVRDDAGKGSPWAGSANDAISLVQGGTGSGVVAIAPDKAIASAKAAMDRGRVPEGLNQLRNTIASLEAASPEEQAKWLPTCWLELGMAYMGQKRFDEAAACFDACQARFPSADQAPTALFQGAMARSQLNGAKNNEFDKSAYLDTLKVLQSKYSSAPETQASSFLLGMERFQARDFAKAAAEFEKTTEKAKKLYDQALYMAGVSHVMEGRRLASEKKNDDAKSEFLQARASLEKAIKWATDGAKVGEAEGERASMLKRLAFDARCRLAEVALFPLIKDPARALEAASAAEKGLGEGAEPDKIAEARLLAVQAHLAADDVAKAEEMVASMGTAAGQSPRTAQAEREVAIAVDKMADAAKKEKKGDSKALYAKAADHYTRWFKVSEDAGVDLSAKDLARAADRLYSLSILVNALPDGTASFVQVEDLKKLEAPSRFADAAAVYEAACKEAGNAADAAMLHMKMGECYGFAGDFDKARKGLMECCARKKLLKEEVEKGEDGKPVKIVSVDVGVASKETILL
ncbi:MAG TPA: tetratricopeptide repeat protein, partial [Planctomycetota bacterium]|nr:tetratricopeptide repeat protein [Planctomycetota bacterium]